MDNNICLPRWLLQLEEELDFKLLVRLRDGRLYLGTLRSFDQFGNLLLDGVHQRLTVFHPELKRVCYADIWLGSLIIRGDNVMLFGRIKGREEEEEEEEVLDTTGMVTTASGNNADQIINGNDRNSRSNQRNNNQKNNNQKNDDQKSTSPPVPLSVIPASACEMIQLPLQEVSRLLIESQQSSSANRNFLWSDFESDDTLIWWPIRLGQQHLIKKWRSALPLFLAQLFLAQPC